MKENRIEEGRFTDRAHGLGTVSEEMVLKRARELAVINGRTPEQVLSGDLEEARRELTRDDQVSPPPPAAELVPEEDRWEGGVAGSEGVQAPTVPAADEQTFAEKLVEEGVEDAELDQSVQATRESLKRETRP